MSPKRRHGSSDQEAEGAEGATRTAPVDPNVALFVQRVREEKDKERAEKRAAKEARRAAQEHQRLIDNKEAAAAELKRLRQAGGAGAAKVAAADAAYRDALAKLLTYETGEEPAWAPPAPADSPGASGEGPDATELSDEAGVAPSEADDAGD